MMEKVPMTALGYAALEDELKQRQSVERPRIIEHIAEARSHGDLSENAEYHAAKEEQSHNEGRIAEIEDKLARADIIDISKLSGDTIKFGATVTLVDEDTDKKQVWQLVGEPEADAKKGRISITSPLARALVNKKKGDSVEVVTPEDFLGDVMGNLNSRRGRIEEMNPMGNATTIKAMVPLSEMFGYATDVRSMTQGRATFTMQFDRYEEVPGSIAAEIVDSQTGSSS